MNLFLLRESIRASAQAGFSRSGGPGGQNVNKVNTKVTLRLCLADLAGLSEREAARLRETLAARLSAGETLVIRADEERSRQINLDRAYARMETLIAASARLPKRRRPTVPTKADREARLKSKRLRSLRKAERRRPPPGE
ncbi:MAG: aminoacyl-tRNA hydrolase [Treponema sp.]|jgi:ribosome-associated protein|nr:aminoacyl-tRNA hydrolase [Treponema sp.]